MKKIGHWSVIVLGFVVIMGSSVAWAQNAIRVPHQALPSFLGYVEDEFIVVFTPEARANLTVTQGPAGKPRVNLPSIQALTDEQSVQRFQRQFRNARPQPPTSQYTDLTGHYKVKLRPGRPLDAAIHAFEANPHVDHVEKIGMHTLSITPNDPYFQNSPNPSFPYDQWHLWDLFGINAESTWDVETGESNVIVGILDSGTRYFHRDLGGDSAPWGPDNPIAGGNVFINPGETPGNGVDDDINGFVDDTIGWDFVTTAGGPGGLSCIDQDCSGADNDPDDGDGHGTHTGGTVGAITNNNFLVAGIAGGFSNGTAGDVGNGVKIIPLRIGYHAKYRGLITGVVRMDWAAEAMTYIADLVDQGVNVAAVNCSWGSSNTGGLNAAVDNLLAHDVMVVHAAGNSNSSSPDFLGSKAGVLNVAATDINGNGASFTNHGSWVDVALPGVDVLSTYRHPDDPDPTHHYIAVMSGTSMSAPHACGIAALLESCDPSLSGPDKFDLIVNLSNTTSYSDSRDLGSGIANAQLALEAAGCTGVFCDIATDFQASPTSGSAPLTVNFTDLSTGTGINGWSWDFGDGNTSTEQHPTYTYNAAGTYPVSLTASSETCSDAETKTAYITVNEVPIAEFSGTPTSGNVPLTVNFTDLSSGNPTSWSWAFGDGGTSTEQTPSYTYIVPGTYTVTLTASNDAGSDMETKENYITVTVQTGGPTEVFVFDIVVTKLSLGRGINQGVATVTIHDDTGNLVAGATVTGDFTRKQTTEPGLTEVTDGSGQATFSSTASKGGGEWCFEVTNVSDTLPYNSSKNVNTRSCESGDVF